MKKSLILAGIIVGLVIAIQFNSKLIANRDTDISEKEDLKTVMAELQKEQNQLKLELVKLREEEGEKLKHVSQNLQEELIKAKSEAGFSKIEGKGLIIRFINNKPIDNFLLTSYLRDIVNLLFSLNAEAISINGYRIVFKTPIISVGDATMLKNFHITDPYEIQVIGNSDFIISALETKEAISDIRQSIKDENIRVEVQKSNNLEIPAYIY